LRRIVPPNASDRDDRRLTQLRFHATANLTRTINRVRSILRRLNIEQQCPTKGMKTVKARAWLKTVPLGELERFEMDQLLAQWKQLEEHRQRIDAQITARAKRRPDVDILRTAPGVSDYTALALVCRIGDIRRFPSGRSLANYWGLTPRCRNSGDKTQRLGGITKDGSGLARYLLGQLVLHVLRKDAGMRSWFSRIKKRRGAKIARVAVMRRLAVIFWHMLAKQQPYELSRPLPNRRHRPASAAPVTAAPATAAPVG
jgi:transposase